MTREDAKVFMRKEWRECMKGSFAESAFEIAIEALEQPERKKGMWIDNHTTCSECGWQMIDDVIESPNIVGFNFCPNCGADMRTPVEIARNIVHKVIDNSVWSDTVDTAKMHKVVDDKYAEMTEDEA